MLPTRPRKTPKYMDDDNPAGCLLLKQIFNLEALFLWANQNIIIYAEGNLSLESNLQLFKNSLSSKLWRQVLSKTYTLSYMGPSLRPKFIQNLVNIALHLKNWPALRFFCFSSELILPFNYSLTDFFFNALDHETPVGFFYEWACNSIEKLNQS